MTEAPGKYELENLGSTYSQRFTSMVVREFSNEIGKLEMTPYQQRLAQHLFVAIDTQLKALDMKRGQNSTPIVWANINMNKLAIDAVHRVELGLDALIPNHIHPIPYMNGKTGKYDLDLRIGYAGKDCYKRKMALDQPVDILYELVYDSDTFVPIKKSSTNEIESYKFEITNPFNRGQVIGGFGYIVYENSKKNKLVMVSKADFDKAKKLAKSDKFWTDYPREMMFKTLVHRALAQIQVDPEKVNASYMKVEIEDTITEAERDIEEGANKEPIDITDYEEVTEEEEKTEAESTEKKEPPIEENKDYPKSIEPDF